MTEEESSASTDPHAGEDVVQRIGRLTRMLHDSMRELGLDKEVEKAAEAIPDARDRLTYVADMTEKAAERSLNAVDRAQPLQDDLSQRAESLEQRWAAWFGEPKELDEARDLVQETRRYLTDVPVQTQATNQELLEIMMAQDFQDLTGQVIKRMMDVIREIEHQLMQVLLDNAPPGASSHHREDEAPRDEEELLNGPQVDPEKQGVVSSQDQVDDLLDDLGF